MRELFELLHTYPVVSLFLACFIFGMTFMICAILSEFATAWSNQGGCCCNCHDQEEDDDSES